MRTLLLVDDIPEYLDTMELNLPDDCRAVRAGSVADAKALIQKEHPALAAVDVRLKEGDEANREGLELLKWIKTYHAGIPVIIISAYREFEFEAEALTLGAERFLRKPVQPDEFREAVKQALMATGN